ncbi:MAG TPA: hypothetical protein PKH10_03350 [bacterium]|nr:hypothetical protein [bacterium]HSA34109.1 hypothetical protein [bacterium]
MVKKIDFLTEYVRQEGARYYREISVDGGFWQVLSDTGLIAFSNLGGFDETVFVLNLGKAEVTAHITVDKDLSAKAKFKDMSGGPQKTYPVKEQDGRCFVTITMKPGYGAVLVKK